MLLTKFHIIWPSSFREKAVLDKSNNKKQELSMTTMFVNRSKRMSNLYREPSIDASYQVLVHLAKRFQRRRFFRNQPIRNKNCLWRSCSLTDWDKMSNIYKRTFHRCFLPSFGSFGHAVSEEKIFRNRPIRNKNRLWRLCLLMESEQNEYFL